MTLQVNSRGWSLSRVIGRQIKSNIAQMPNIFLKKQSEVSTKKVVFVSQLWFAQLCAEGMC